MLKCRIYHSFLPRACIFNRETIIFKKKVIIADLKGKQLMNFIQVSSSSSQNPYSVVADYLLAR